MLESLNSFVTSILAFALVLGVLIFVHEYGHYWAARRVGIRVEVFSIGFGRAVWSRTAKDGVVWKLGWLPLGGYVKLFGQEPQADDQAAVQQDAARREQMHKSLPPDSFAARPVWARAFAVAAGPLANFLLAAVLFSALFAIAGQRVVAPVIGEVVAGMPAEAAGLRAGDRVTAIDSHPIIRFDDIQARVRESGGQALEFMVRRDGAEQRFSIAPARRDGALLLGIRGGATEVRELGPLQAVSAGVAETWRITAATFDALWGMVTLSRSAEDLGGPIAIARMSGEVAQLGIAAMVTFIAVLSVNLGLLNLLPIPVLDGGHLVMFGAEALRGRPLPARAVEYGFRAGFALLLMIFVAVTWKDLAGIGAFRWVSGLFG